MAGQKTTTTGSPGAIQLFGDDGAEDTTAHDLSTYIVGGNDSSDGNDCVQTATGGAD